MKTLKITLIIIISMFTAKANAQIKITTNGYVGIGGITTPNEALEINGNIRGNVAGGALKINTVSNGYAILGPQNNTACHMYTDRPYFGFNQTVVTIKGDFGSYYTADLIFKTGVSAYNYAGTVRMTINNSTGYVGINNTSPSYLLDVNGIIRGTNVTPSDERLKENIKNLSGALASMVKLKGVTYRLKPTGTTSNSVALKSAIATKSDTGKVQDVAQATDSVLYNRNHIGFLAQEIQKVYPELVYADKNGILSVDYISLIPVLVESIKELNYKHTTDSLDFQKRIVLLNNRIIEDSIYFENKLKSLENKLNQCCGKPKLKSEQIGDISNDSSNPIDVAALYQNIPNPFNQTTTIGYYLPSNVVRAIIYIYNMQGIQIKSIPITDRGNGNVVVYGNVLNAGMYLYTLIVDGKEIDTKRMILTD